MEVSPEQRDQARALLERGGAAHSSLQVESQAADLLKGDAGAYWQVMTDLVWLADHGLPVRDPDNFLWSTREEKLQGTEQAANVAAEHQRAALEERLLQENLETAMSELAGVMRCSKCKSNRIAINQKQSRAADEGMTLYCLCECGHAWKM